MLVVHDMFASQALNVWRCVLILFEIFQLVLLKKKKKRKKILDKINGFVIHSFSLAAL